MPLIKTLIVDDNPMARLALKHLVSKVDYLSLAGECTNPIDAINFLNKEKVDLILLDVMMPGEDGLSFARWLRGRSGETGKTPVLVLTARGEPDDRIAGLSLGVDDYLAKPFEPQELVLRIEAILRRVGPRPGADGPLRLGDCSFDVGRGELRRGDHDPRQTPRYRTLPGPAGQGCARSGDLG